MNLTGTTIHGWNVGEAVTKWWRGKFVSLYRLRKNCGQCGVEMVLDVTKSAIQGTAKNSGLHIMRCTACRDASHSQGSTSRPTTVTTTETAAAAGPVDTEELERLRMSNKIMKEELDGLYAELRALKASKLPWE
jgi:predicted RNA-binding Zn-ribbon protein involved in translation (DUF1610 family)